MRTKRLLTKAQLKKIEKIIQRRMRAFSLRTLGPQSLSEDEIAELKSAGLFPARIKNYVGDAHVLGKLAATLGPSGASSLTLQQIMDMAKKMPTTKVEEKAIQYAVDHAGEYINGIASDLVKDVTLRATKTSMEVLRQTVSEGIKDRITPSQLKSNLFHALDNRGRDWARVASTELQNAIQTAIYHEMKASSDDGENQLCYKRPSPNACKHCKRVFLHADGTPKIFRMKDLATSNVGLKAADWKPTVEAVHPWCQCQLHMLPAGYGFKKKPTAAEEFEFNGKTYGKGALIDEESYAALPATLKRKLKMDSILEFTGEEIEPVSKAEINLPIEEEHDDCVCEY